MKKIKGLCEDLAERLDLPREAVGGAVRLTAVDDQRLLIENHRGLLRYGAECIRVSTGRGAICVVGAELRMCAMDRSALLIRGRLQSLSWE